MTKILETDVLLLMLLISTFCLLLGYFIGVMVGINKSFDKLEEIRKKH
jgi:type III secretory pathway component EscS